MYLEGKISGVSGWTGHDPVTAPNSNWYNYQGFVNHATVKNGIATSGDVYKHANHIYPLFETTQKYINIHADVLFNLSNMIGGYNQERFTFIHSFCKCWFWLIT